MQDQRRLALTEFLFAENTVQHHAMTNPHIRSRVPTSRNLRLRPTIRSLR